MNAVIIEDEPAVKRILVNLLKEYCPEIEVIGSADNVSSGITTVKNCKPELVFLDVELHDGTGFDVLKGLSFTGFQVIFITAHEKYALKAIKFSALDFLLKPIDADDLVEAVNKAKKALTSNWLSKKVKVLMQNLHQPNSTPDKIVLHDKYGIQIVETKDIIRLESAGSYTTFHLIGSSPFTVSKGLKEYEKMLDPEVFFRCHQSHLINLNFLSRYDRKNGDFLILKEDSKIPLAGRRREIMMEVIKKL